MAAVGVAAVAAAAGLRAAPGDSEAAVRMVGREGEEAGRAAVMAKGRRASKRLRCIWSRALLADMAVRRNRTAANLCHYGLHSQSSVSLGHRSRRRWSTRSQLWRGRETTWSRCTGTDGAGSSRSPTGVQKSAAHAKERALNST